MPAFTILQTPDYHKPDFTINTANHHAIYRVIKSGSDIDTKPCLDSAADHDLPPAKRALGLGGAIRRSGRAATALQCGKRRQISLASAPY